MRRKVDVSVVIPTYNRCSIVRRAIDSALNQTRPAREVIVVDDGSTDGTAEWVKKHYGCRVRVIAQSNKGVAGARNSGILEASSDLIAFLDSDDEWLPEKLELQIQHMKNPKVVLSFTNWTYAIASTQTSHPHQYRPSGFRRKSMRSRDWAAITKPLSLLCGPNSEHVLLPTCIISRDALLRVGMMDERMKLAEDIKLLYQMAFEGYFASCAEPLCKIYLDDDRGHCLTRPSDDNYLRRNRTAMYGILMGAYARTSSTGYLEQRFIRKALSSLCAEQAVTLASVGPRKMARHKAMESLALGAVGGDALRAICTVVSPRLCSMLVRVKARWRGMDASDGPAEVKDSNGGGS